MNSQSALRIIEVSRFSALVVLVLLFTSTNNLLAQSSQEKQRVINEVLAHIYDYKFSSAGTMLDSLQRVEPSSTEWHLLRANVAWWQLLAGKVNDPELERMFESNLEAVTKQLDKKNLTLEQTYQAILVRAFEARYALLNENYLAGVRQLNACIDQVSETFGNEPQFEPLYLTSGLYYYFMQMAHEDYIFLRPYLMFFPDGDKAQGLQYLQRMANTNDVFLRNEGHYFLLRIYYDVEKDYAKAREQVADLLKRHPENLIYRLFSYKTELAIGDEDLTLREKNRYLNSIERNEELDAEERVFYVNLLEEE